MADYGQSSHRYDQLIMVTAAPIMHLKVTALFMVINLDPESN